jgi:magnesium transporter
MRLKEKNMKNPLLIPEIRELLKKKRHKALKAFLAEQHEKEAAEFLSLLQPNEIWRVLNILDSYRRAKIFSYMDIDVQVSMISSGLRKYVIELLTPMSHDDRADLFQHLEKDVADKLLLYLPVKERRDILHLTTYSEGTVGAIMTTDFVALHEDDTVEKSIRKIRREAPSKETIYYTYVVTSDNTLIGFISLRNLILAKPKSKVKEIMKTDIISILVSNDQEVAAQLIEEYDLLALPVLDQQQRMLGIITYDDAIDIIREEETEDLQKLMAISGPVPEKTYLDVPALTHFKKRAFWVLILGVFGFFTGLIVQSFQDALQTLIILTSYIPLLLATGGNTGSQSASVILRSLALNELHPKHVFKVLKKEVVVSLLLSLCLGGMTYLRVYYFSSASTIPQQFSISLIALVVALALAIQIVWSTVFGAFIPIMATKLKIDPALFSSPALTTLVDMGGITIYFTCIKLILGI